MQYSQHTMEENKIKDMKAGKVKTETNRRYGYQCGKSQTVTFWMGKRVRLGHTKITTGNTLYLYTRHQKLESDILKGLT